MIYLIAMYLLWFVYVNIVHQCYVLLRRTTVSVLAGKEVSVFTAQPERSLSIRSQHAKLWSSIYMWLGSL